MPTLADYAAQDEAYNKQAAAQAAQKAQEDAQAEQDQPPSLLQRFGGAVGRASVSMLDSAVSSADAWGTAIKRVGQDVTAGAVTGAANIADAAGSALTTSGRGMAAAEDPAHAEDAQTGEFPTSPIWDHAKGAIMDFRDAVQVKDPNIVDNLTQGVAQLAIPFAGFSRALAGLHGVANIVASGAATDLTALAPHDMRMADVFSLGRTAEGKLGDALRTLAPDGSALNAYINFLGDRGNETEAEGRFKNVLDGFGGNLIATPLIHAAGIVLKQGTSALRYTMDNGVRNTVSDLFQAGPPSGSPAAQAGKIGYHGTPNAPFDAFDNSKIGTGQGAQSFGYGHYIAENAATGETYQKSLSGRMNNSAALTSAQDAITAAGGDKVKAFKALTEQAATEQDAGLRQRMLNSARIIKSGAADQGKGSLLKVDIPEAHIDNMLDLDKPLEDQPEILKKIPAKEQQKLQSVLDDHGQDLDLSELTGNEFRQLIERAHSEDYMPVQGEDDGNAPRQASAYLSSRGIPGNKYLDSKSRVTGEGTRNYVVFDGKHIKVMGQGK